MRQIIAIGGGGLGRKITDLKIEKYILNQCCKKDITSIANIKFNIKTLQ